MNILHRAAGLSLAMLAIGGSLLADPRPTQAGQHPNRPPVAQAQDVRVGNDPGLCSADLGAGAFDNGSFDPDGDAITLTVVPTGPYPVGTTSVVLTATDSRGASASDVANITVVDVEAPSINGASVDKSALWPPNHQMIDVHVAYTATDNCGVVSTALSVSSNESLNGRGDGNTESDWEVLDAHNVRLRAERSGNGKGRVYTVTITATDAAGNSSSSSVTVRVQHDQRGRGGSGIGGGKGKGKGDDKGNGNGGGNGNGNGGGNGNGNGGGNGKKK